MLDRIEPANPSADNDGFDEIRNQVRVAMASDLLSQYTDALRGVYPVTVNSGALQRLFDEGAIRP